MYAVNRWLFLTSLVASVLVPRALAQNSVSIRAVGILENGERVSNVRIVREEIERTTLLPLLPYVFFDALSSSIPSRYTLLSRSEAQLFSFTEFTTTQSTGQRSTINAYYNILNIIGKRLRDNPALSLTVQGGTAVDEAPELADQRASSVVDYLQSRFDLSDSRVRRGKALRQGVNEEDSRLTDEYRRVTFSSEWEITKPVVIRDTTTTITPPVLDFEIASNIGGVNDVQLSAWQKDIDSALFYYADIELPTSPVRWDLEIDREHQPVTDEDLKAQVLIADAGFKKYFSSIVKIPVDQYNLYRKKAGQVVGGREIHQYNLILFDRGSSDLRPDHYRIIDSMIADDGYLQPTSNVRTIGYADSTGTIEQNIRLSSARAQNTTKRVLARYQGVINKDNVSETRGVGSYDVLGLADGLSTPESRFYSRTVFIIIENRPSW